MSDELIEFDYSKLKGKIVEKYDLGGIKKLAEEIGMSYDLLRAKLCNVRKFSQQDIYKISKKLGITDINDYFFKVKC